MSRVSHLYTASAYIRELVCTAIKKGAVIEIRKSERNKCGNILHTISEYPCRHPTKHNRSGALSQVTPYAIVALALLGFGK